MNVNHCLNFTVERANHQREEKRFHIEELGRTFKDHPVDIETWSKGSGYPVPEKCRVPFAYPPISLPLNLKMNRWVEDYDEYYFDFTNLHHNHFRVEIPPKDLPEFLPEVFTMERCLTWALREKVDLSHVEIFASGPALRSFAMTAYEHTSKPWALALLHYKGKIFMGGSIKEELKYWLRGLNAPDADHGKIIEQLPAPLKRFPPSAINILVGKSML